ncbi:universal stress protein [Nonomuraea rubra]|uniref:universal stress protein n=1 Tax=Nonomuraea rubra TaxID=46180 RepID=UPI003329182D
MGRCRARRPDRERCDLRACQRWYDRFPEVAVAREELTGRPGKALVRTADQASLLVVGSHHHSEVSALMKGSVSQTALHQAACPAAIISLHP